MCFAADPISSASGNGAVWGNCALTAKTTISSTTGTGTGSRPRAWTA